MSTRARRTGIALLVALNAACGGGSSTPDTLAPTVAILFPPAAALATTATLTITGTATDDRGVAGVTANGVDATSSDGFATWRATVALAPGVTAVSVEARDAAGNTALAVVQVTRVAAVLAAPGGIAFHVARGDAFVVDRAQGALFAVDVASGTPSVVSGSLAAPQGLVLDVANDRALVVDSGLEALVAVDLDTGAVAVLSDATTGAGPALASPRAVDADADHAWVVDNLLRNLVRIDLATGDRTVVATGLANPQGVRLDPDGGAALVADGARLVRVDLATGVVTEITGDGPAFGNAMGLAVDAPNRRVFVADALLAAVLAVDLDTGERTVVADADLAFPAAVAFDAAGARVLVADTVRDAALAVDVATGAVAALWESRFGAGAPLAGPRDVALDGARALVADFARGLVAVATDRTDVDGGGPDFQVPLGVAVDAAGGRALVADSAAAALFAVDLATGARTVVADGFAGPTGVAHDASRDMAYLLDGAVFLAVELASGGSAPLPAGSGPALVVPRGFAFDAVRGRLLVVDDGLDALLAVDVTTGVRTQVAGGFSVPADVALDPAGRAFVVDTDFDGIVVVDLATGARTEVTGAGPPLLSPVAVAYDGRLVVIDAGLSALLAVDPETGERVILSK